MTPVCFILKISGSTGSDWVRWIRRAILFTLVWVALPAAANPDALLDRLVRERRDGVVFDFARVISATQRQDMERILLDIEQRTGAQVKVVTLTSLEGGSIEDFANRLFERWKIGRAGKDDGVLLLAAMEDRRVRIEVGYGLESVFTDAFSGRLLDQFVLPPMRSGHPGQAMVAGAEAIAEVIARKAGMPPRTTGLREGAASAGGEERQRIHPLLALLFVIGMIYIAIRHPILFLLLLNSGSRGGRGFSGGGFGGGGFGGFGGGMSGGGGASRGW